MTPVVTKELKRDRAGFVESVDHSDGRTTKIVRDQQGRIKELRSSHDPWLLAVAEAVADLEDRNVDLGPLLDAVVALVERSASREDVEAAVAGWVRVDGLLVSERALGEAATRLGVRTRVTVQWIGADDMSLSDHEGWYTHTPEGGHVLHVRRGLTAQRTAYVLAHEMAHASQLERTREKFPSAYEEHRSEFEAEARELAGSTADLNIVRAS